MSGCVSHYYDSFKSNTSVAVNQDRIMNYKYFGSMNLLGFYMKDTVCILADSDYCVEKFVFFEIVHAKGLQTDGILGLSPYR